MQHDDWDDDYDDEPQDECEHVDYDIDILTGRAECNSCTHTWYATSDEIDFQIEWQARYQADMERENRRQWWRDLFEQIAGPLRRLKWRQRRPVELDDEIPF